MSLFSDYFLEKADAHTIETDYGFIVYQLIEDECYIKEYYITPQMRMTKVHLTFFDFVYDVAKKAGCKFVSCSIHLKSNDPETALLFNLKNGFKLHSAMNGVIILTRELGDGRYGTESGEDG